jgi:hypothetical protein
MLIGAFGRVTQIYSACVQQVMNKTREQKRLGDDVAKNDERRKQMGDKLPSESCNADEVIPDERCKPAHVSGSGFEDIMSPAK